MAIRVNDRISLDDDEIRRGLRARTLAGEIVVAMCGSAFKNKGVQALLDAVIDYMPAPVDVPAIRGILEDETEGKRKPATAEWYKDPSRIIVRDYTFRPDTTERIIGIRIPKRISIHLCKGGFGGLTWVGF